MGKRSNLKRIARDFYQTPQAAVLPLLPHVPIGATFYEPCAGAGDLVSHLTGAGLKCVWACDIEPQAESVDFGDAFAFYGRDADYIITNPPWERKTLHPLIEHLSDLLPTWLLFDSDWVHTRQSAPFMKRLVRIVSVGRVKWMPDSKMTGKDNCAWHLFDASHDGPTCFYGRTELKILRLILEETL